MDRSDSDVDSVSFVRVSEGGGLVSDLFNGHSTSSAAIPADSNTSRQENRLL